MPEARDSGKPLPAPAPAAPSRPEPALPQPALPRPGLPEPGLPRPTSPESALPRRRRRSSGTALAGGILVLALVATAVAAPWLAPWEPGHQLDPVAGRYLPPGSVRVPVVFTDGRSLLAESVERSGGELVVARLGRVERYPAAAVAEPAAGEPGRPRRFHLGTDRFGRDVLSRLLHGARVSLAIGVLAAVLALGVGTLVGAAAAAGGAWADSVLMRLVDAVLAVPRLFLLIALVALFRPGLAALVVVLGATGWMTVSRLVRAEIQALQGREFVLAARSLGQHPVRILAVHLLPNALTPVLVIGGLLVGQAILAESSLSFLGLGVPAPVPSWGEMVASGADRLLGAWWVATFPGIAIVVAVAAFNLLTDGLRDLLDPRH